MNQDNDSKGKMDENTLIGKFEERFKTIFQKRTAKYNQRIADSKHYLTVIRTYNNFGLNEVFDVYEMSYCKITNKFSTNILSGLRKADFEF